MLRGSMNPVSTFLACLMTVTVAVGGVAVEAYAEQGEPPYVAQTVDTSGLPVLLRAEEIVHDQELGVVVARGNVEIAHGDRIMLADTLSYNQNAKTVTASGNVQILEPDGEVIFADYVELTEDLRDGTIENIRILLIDNARLAAAGGRRSNGNSTEMAKAVYSACEVCRDDPSKAPLWQVRADRVIHDQANKTVDYYDATLEMYGVPVAYAPYFTHPDPTVERQSGLLPPSFGSKTNTGIYLRTPYFWDVAPDKNATFDPIFTADQIGILSGEYEQAFDTGEFIISGSATMADRDIGSPKFIRTETDVFRGHVFTEGQFHLNETWRWGWDMNRSTDQTYLRKFSFWEQPRNSFNSSNTLTSTAYAEGFRGRNYMAARAFSFQDLRLGQRSDTPLILPLLEYNGFGEAGSSGGRWSLDSSIRGLTDGDAADSQSASVEAGYQREFISNWGLLTTVSGSLRGDVYNVSQYGNFDSSGRNVEDGLTGRVIPRIGMEMRYPLARYSVGGRQIIEPIAAFHAATNGGNNENIPNSDSTLFETDDINILTANRANGIDRVETGQKVVAGLNMANYDDNGGRISLFLGQSFRLRDDHSLKTDTGIENGRSDWVGRLEVSPNEYVNAFYRFNYATDELLANRNEFSMNIGGEGLRFNTNYTFVRSNIDPTTSNVEELSLGVTSKLNDFWTVQAATLQDLRVGQGTLQHLGRLTYEDECFIFVTQYTKRYIRSVDLSEENSIMFQLTFKTMGEVTF